MKPIQILYSETFQHGTGFRKMHIIGELTPDDDVKQCFYELKKQVQNFHHESTGAERKKQEEVIPQNKEQSFIDTINSCTSLKSVEIFRKLVERENIPELTTAFENKIKSFEQ